LNVAIFGSFFLLFGWFQFLIIDGWFLLGIVFLGTMFSCFSLVSATSSYADDIAYIKILYEQKPWWFPQPRGRGVRFSFLFYGGTDFLLLLTGIF
jgi:hypothetical protein